MEFGPPNQDEFESRKKKLDLALQEVENISDKLGKGIDDGIKETIALLLAMDFPTSSSCAGHFKIEEGVGMPYIRIYAPAPEGWESDKQNKDLRERWKQENLKYRNKIQKLLDEYNQKKDSSAAQLRISNIGVFGGFQIESESDL